MKSDSFFVIENLNKRFGATIANDDISLVINKGEVRGFAGENGSGKSTLCLIIGGIYQMDEGKMHKNGQLYTPASPIDANNQGVAMVVQELGVLESLSVAENIFLGKTEQFTNRGLLNNRKMNKAAEEHLRDWGIDDIPVDIKAGALSIEQRKLVELVRALSVDPDILILDEITQALSHDKRELLYKIMTRCTEMGKTIIAVTHDIDEMLRITDNITVLRDGSVVGTVKSSETSDSTLRRMMIGREISGDYYRSDYQESGQEEVILSVQNLTTRKIRDISFDLHKGEILAVCGLSDAGIRELGKAMCGLVEHRTGKVVDMKSGKNLKTVEDIVKVDGAYLSKDRDGDGLMLNASVKDNLFMPSAKKLANRVGFIAPGKIKDLTSEAVTSMSIKTFDPYEQKVVSLSGGNKQKVNLSRWLIQDLNFMILDCPTRGVDVGVKAYIYRVMEEAKEEGLAIVMITDELPEAIGMADRIIVLKAGSIAQVFKRSEKVTEESIIEVMM